MATISRKYESYNKGPGTLADSPYPTIYDRLTCTGCVLSLLKLYSFLYITQSFVRLRLANFFTYPYPNLFTSLFACLIFHKKKQ